jgi:hypothetical protein
MAKVLEFRGLGAREMAGARGATATLARAAAPRFPDALTVRSVKSVARGAIAVGEAGAAAASRAVVNFREAMPGAGSAAVDPVGTSAAAGDAAQRKTWCARKFQSAGGAASAALAGVIRQFRIAPRPVKFFVIIALGSALLLGLVHLVGRITGPTALSAEQDAPLPANAIGSRMNAVVGNASESQNPTAQGGHADTLALPSGSATAVRVDHVIAPARALKSSGNTDRVGGTAGDKKPAAKPPAVDRKSSGGEKSTGQKSASEKSPDRKSSAKRVAAQEPEPSKAASPAQQIDITTPQ